MIRRVLWILAIGVVLTACGGEKPADPSHPTDRSHPSDRSSSAPPRPVHTAAVEQSGGGSITVPATVAARQSATLAARIPAAIRELPHREGEAVGAGSIVVRLDDAALRSGVQAAQAGAQAAESDLARMQTLAQHGAATPRELEEATARAAAARAVLSGARENLSYAVLRSPFAGVLASRKVEVGDVVSPGQPLVVIEGRGGLELRATLSAGETQALRPGTAIQTLVDGIAEPLQARVTALSPAGDPATHRFELRADLPAKPNLRSGLFARLLLKAPEAGEVTLSVPSAAVFRRGGLTGVFVAADESGRKIARLRWIADGAPDGDRIEVRAGLAAGERVVLDPGDLADGDPLAAKEAL
jgi:RND family efflux transporter MFP subunit